jgi:RHH-type rel operon transcriptional repressor/antitoxin RelB
MIATTMKSVSLRIPDVIYDRISKLARETHRTKTFFMLECILEHIEDVEDYYEAIDSYNDNDGYISAEELWKSCGV